MHLLSLTTIPNDTFASMLSPRALPKLAGPLYRRVRLNGSVRSRYRFMATDTLTTAIRTLPLAGIRVLDMTRVLAGVCRRPPIHIYLGSH